MTSYAAIGRLRAVDVRRVAAPRSSVPSATSASRQVEVEELSGRPLTARLAEVREQVREQWTMTTFYLFDAESWR